MTPLNFDVLVDGMEEGELLLTKYHGFESMSQVALNGNEQCNGFRFELELASRISTITADHVVDKNVTIKIIRAGQDAQVIHGVVKSFTRKDTGHHHTFYSMLVVPALERLSLRQNSRIFQQQSVPEILSILLQEMAIEDYAFALNGQFEKREFCVQYRETDLEFFHRLAAEEGLVYSFLHEEAKHTLYISDSSDQLPAFAMPVPYNAMSGGMVDEPYVNYFKLTSEAAPSQTSLKDYSFKKPAFSFQQQEMATQAEYQLTDKYEHFDFPGRFKQDGVGKKFNLTRLNALRRSAISAELKSNHPSIRAGYKFDLMEHSNVELNRDWVIVLASHQGEQPQALEEDGGEGATTYANQFTVIPADTNWQAPICAKPQVDGPTVAIVVGPAGEEIFCDEHGRVKLHFPWDRYSNSDEQSSCWVRVSHDWAGSQYGLVTLPRIGQEVIVDFLNGDPDQPVIIGRTFHASNTPPYPLPANKTKTVLRSESHQGQGYNELSFEDQAESEKIYLHAQKDLNAEIKNDATAHIKHDKHLTIDNDQFSEVVNQNNLTVEGECRLKVVGDKIEFLDSNLYQKSGKRFALDAANAIHCKAGSKVVIEAGSEITLKAGGSFVKVDGAGVHVSGAKVNMNSGGGKGSGQGFSGQAALKPGQLEAAPPLPNPVLSPAQVATMSAAAPFCEECEACKDGECSA
ncbi:type VI secretion system tip protein TssI/VgrG [Vibrio intestinalis]|uniref:type VI secretion system tip protein TssI/VgrG n=1 Tax=Vibrio intestinalis TaxID=2933291 RepID=UPI0021A2EAEF|nr:type VI secretion system tip protein TssI/VgrG [Vibrio intestinalis]